MLLIVVGGVEPLNKHSGTSYTDCGNDNGRISRQSTYSNKDCYTIYQKNLAPCYGAIFSH